MSVVETQKISLRWSVYSDTSIVYLDLCGIVLETSSSILPRITGARGRAVSHSADIKPLVEVGRVLVAISDTFVEILCAVGRPNKSCRISETNQNWVLRSPSVRSCAHHDLGHQAFSADCDLQTSTDFRASLFELVDIFDLVS